MDIQSISENGLHIINQLTCKIITPRNTGTGIIVQIENNFIIT
ncbi:MAG: hypothetical protein P8078_06220 [bacterium]